MVDKLNYKIEAAEVIVNVDGADYPLALNSFTIEDSVAQSIVGPNNDKNGTSSVAFLTGLQEPATLSTSAFNLDIALVKLLNKKIANANPVQLTYFDKNKNRNVINLEVYVATPIANVNATENNDGFCIRQLNFLTRERGKIYEGWDEWEATI